MQYSVKGAKDPAPGISVSPNRRGGAGGLLPEEEDLWLTINAIGVVDIYLPNCLKKETRFIGVEVWRSTMVLFHSKEQEVSKHS
ncbi:hypothetical protein N665_2031s0003 [Sinapis alba]|nr:hypothetical protein N665_2031s0003 [Sinapis alba]